MPDRSTAAAIPRNVIRHLQGLTVDAKALHEARAEICRIKPGQRAKIAAGPLEGFAVDVTEVKNGIAWFDFVTGGKGKADVASLVADLNDKALTLEDVVGLGVQQISR
ncbi:hypothetical protein SLH49_11215 [Cognatiyoonia sp. IB215446]|uniref:hypothetical protein n=1 Tax=Cognatiyoonia sp. IB215446 TaxID=3097355 RepID=UPI002A12F6C3|nr:hypothetical protein [Cognatiyoonia sp. IB215446]MDX8348557.1 hypothetical protein [Cognatiyoonia sp. IB215446]